MMCDVHGNHKYCADAVNKLVESAISVAQRGRRGQATANWVLIMHFTAKCH